MDPRRCQLLTLIEHAFAGVELGDGVSMKEAIVIEGYGSDEERREARDGDEQKDWRLVINHPDLEHDLAHPYYGFCFLDPAGFRFYLPACLSRLLLDEYVPSPDYPGVETLPCSLMLRLGADENTNFLDPERHEALSAVQRACVGEVLSLFRDLIGAVDEDRLYEILAVDYDEYVRASERRDLAGHFDRAVREFWSPGSGPIRMRSETN